MFHSLYTAEWSDFDGRGGNLGTGHSYDGILVEAMQDGALLLIDEISLANDSVLERLNSVFEQDRTLMVTEKSSQEAIKIVAHEKFNMVATMNPSGDFGKKELSPALRNRMTEIWVESYF